MVNWSFWNRTLVSITYILSYPVSHAHKQLSLASIANIAWLTFPRSVEAAAERDNYYSRPLTALLDEIPSVERERSFQDGIVHCASNATRNYNSNMHKSNRDQLVGVRRVLLLVSYIGLIKSGFFGKSL
ncbi:hypothetical protein GYMLUDRAFT_647260 [Collybiopsis luxurians FD-317 M1]|nr:hypothetical protein GYMLUDRAFT_647260 [Collybiopsis luxurians FD-317 M1]